MVASVDDLEIAGQVIASTGIQPFLGQKSDPEHRGWAVSRFAFIEFPEEMKRANRRLFGDEFFAFGKGLTEGIAPQQRR